MMQLRLVILLLWFGYLNYDVGYIENSNIIYLNFFLLQSCVGSLGKIRLLKLNLSASKMVDALKKFSLLRYCLSKNLSLTTVVKFVINFCNQFFTTVASFFPHCKIVSTFTATLLQSMSRSTNISHQMEYLLATGNLVSRSGLGLMQVRIDKIRCTVEHVIKAFFQQ